MAVNIGSMYASLTLDSRGYATGWNRAAAITASQSANMRRHVVASQSAMARHFSETAAAVSVLHGPLGGIASRFAAMGSLLGRTNAALAITAVSFSALGFGSYAFVRVADRAKLMSNQLRTVTTGTSNLADIQGKLFDVSQRTRSSLEASTSIYARTARATEHLGISQEKLLRITETVQKAFAVGGASTAEAQGAAIQLSQGIASDRFSGDEFRSVAENAPVLLRGMAESLGVTIGKLREMAHAGQLTAAVVTKAILDSSAAIDAEFSKTEATVGQATTRLSNALLMYVGDVNETFGFTRALASSLSSLADNFNGLANAALLAGAAIASAIGGRVLSGAARGAAGLFSGGITRAAMAQRSSLIGERAAVAAQRDALRSQIGAPMAEVEATRLAKVAQATQIRNNIEKDLNGILTQRKVVESAILSSKSGQLSALANSVGASERVKKISGDILKNESFITSAKVRQTEIERGLNSLYGKTDSRSIARYKALTKESNDLARSTVTAQNAIIRGQERLSSALRADLDGVTKQVAAARGNLAAAQGAVARAANGDVRAIAAANEQRRVAAAQLTALNARYAALTTQITALGRAATFSGAAMSMISRAGSSLLGFLGGWWGVTFMAAIGALLYWQTQSAKAAKATEDFKKNLVDLGYVVEKSSAGVRDGLDFAGLRGEVDGAVVQIEKLKNELDGIDLSITRMQSRAAGGTQFSVGGLVDTATTKQFQDLIDRIQKGSASLADIRAELGRLATENSGVDQIVVTIGKLATQLDGARRYTADLRGEFKKLLFDFSMFPGFESLGQILKQYEGFASARDSGSKMLREINAEHEKEISLLRLGNEERKKEQYYREALEKLKGERDIDGKGKGSGVGATPSAWKTIEDEARRLAEAKVAAERYGKAIDDAREQQKKFSEGMEKLRLEALAAPLDDFGRSVVSTAQSLGIASAEIEQFIRAALGGGLDQVPAKFRAIADAIRDTKLAGLTRDINFEREQIGRTSGEQDIASKLREVFGDNYAKHMDGAVAAQMRLNQELQFTHDIGQDAFKGIISDLRQGASLSEAFGNAALNALGRVADKLAEMAFSSLWTNALGPLFGGVFGGGFSGGGFASGGNPWGSVLKAGVNFAGGGYTGAGSKYKPAGIVHAGEFVVNSDATRKNRGLLEAINAGILSGFADGGFVDPSRSGALARLPGANLGVMAKEVSRGGEQKTAPQIIMNNDFRGVDPSMRAWIETRLRQVKAEAVAASPAAVAKHRSHTPQYLRGGQ